MQRNYVHAAQMIREMQKILLEDPNATASMNKHPAMLSFEFTCGPDTWSVKMTKLKDDAPALNSGYKEFFVNAAVAFAALNSRTCLLTKGFKECICDGDEKLHMVADVHIS
jgi:hypothetical protein